MSAIPTTTPHPISRPEPLRKSQLYWAIADTLVIVKRQLIHTRRIPMELVGFAIMPIMFVVLFRYVFAGAIDVGNGMSYVNFLMAGIFVQSLAFSAPHTGITLTQDLQKGLIDRFRSLPMAHSAYLTGRIIADVIKNGFAIAVMVIVGLAVGFRPEAGLIGWLAAIGVMLFFAFAMCWLGATIALLVRSPESVDQMLFTALFPLTFASSAFVPASSMPGWLQVFVNHQPVTLVVNTVRGLLLDMPVGNDGWMALAWCVAILVICVPAAVSLYQRTTSR
ncbi:MAG TPA: ABC transporter permease [Nitrolancea sp.]|nr:ABC transporter permease [Nitrolancea sp.]